MGEELYMGGRETKMGVAIADDIMGPYVKSEYNPVTNSGHETCLWKYNGELQHFSVRMVWKKHDQFAEDRLILKLNQ